MAAITKTIKTDLDAMNDISSILVQAGIADAITGEMRIAQRRLGSTKEDCVINCLIWDADQFQRGIFNVNFHVPNLNDQVSENPTARDNTQPNITRMVELGEMAFKALDDYHGHDFSLTLRNPGKLETDGGSKWLYNIEVNYNYLRFDKLG